MQNSIQIVHGIPSKLRESSASLYDVAFGAKLSIAIPNTKSRLQVLQKGFESQHAFVAVCNESLAGIAGYKTSEGSLTGGITFRMLRDELGLWSGIRAMFMFMMFHRRLAEDQLLMDGISVSPKMRGKGIGSMLLDQIIGYARDNGFKTVRLDVIDTNPDAKRLYERMGFVAVSTSRFRYLKWLLGFSATTRMEYLL